MIDTHCHLVPGVDDGPADLVEALELARALVADGISAVVCTPHYARMFPYRHETAVERFGSLTETLAASGLALKATLAAEIHPTLAISAPLEELQQRSIAGRFAVVEMLPDTPGPFLASASARLAEAGLLPIFAHPERSRAVQRHLGLLDEARQHGALIQVVAPSLLGRWGADTQATAWRLVDTGRTDLVGSDAHGIRRRRVHLREAANAIAKKLGPAVVDRLLRHNPREVVAGTYQPSEGGAY